jgi:hypothetical protein
MDIRALRAAAAEIATATALIEKAIGTRPASTVPLETEIVTETETATETKTETTTTETELEIKLATATVIERERTVPA